MNAGAVTLPYPLTGATIYPHLIDPTSPSRNFDVLGKDSKTIYFQVITGEHTPPNLELHRAGLFIPVTIEFA